MKKDTILKLIKSTEAVFVIGFALLGWFLGYLTFFWALILSGGYVALNIFGYAARPINKVKEELEEKFTKKQMIDFVNHVQTSSKYKTKSGRKISTSQKLESFVDEISKKP